MEQLPTQIEHITSFTGAVCVAALLQWHQDNSALTGVNRSITTTEIGRSYSGSCAPLPSKEDVKTFERFADQWKRETLDFSSLTEMVAHPAYLGIISMGKVATPLLLAELEKKPAHWFVALAAINQTNPVPVEHAGNLRKMTEAWLKWGRERPV